MKIGSSLGLLRCNCTTTRFIKINSIYQKMYIKKSVHIKQNAFMTHSLWSFQFITVLEWRIPTCFALWASSRDTLSTKGSWHLQQQPKINKSGVPNKGFQMVTTPAFQKEPDRLGAVSVLPTWPRPEPCGQDTHCL